MKIRMPPAFGHSVFGFVSDFVLRASDLVYGARGERETLHIVTEVDNGPKAF